MKFKEKYPNQAIDAIFHNPANYFPKEKAENSSVDNGMCRTGTFYGCQVCGTNTDWADSTLEYVKFCSEECRVKFKEAVDKKENEE